MSHLAAEPTPPPRRQTSDLLARGLILLVFAVLIGVWLWGKSLPPQTECLCSDWPLGR